MSAGNLPATRCERLARSGWPLTEAGRAALRDELEAGIKDCAESAPYLALLGALWLETGEARQALLWLERALLIDPSSLGARADHALALAALGETAARDALLAEWHDRTDVPPALMRRLRGRVPPTNGARLAHAAPGQPRWLRRGEIAVRFGYDTNLDRAPALDSITLTPPPIGPIELPLAVPLRPRTGQTTQLDLGWRVARDSGANSLWQASIGGAARHSPSEPGTDWHYLQGRLEYWQGFGGPWRGHIYGSIGRSAGALSEAYAIARLGVAGERDIGRCVYRGALEGEMQRQEESRYLDGNVAGVTLFTQCAFDRRDNWRGAFELRYSVDRPHNPDRPGGLQRQHAVAARVTGSAFGVQFDGTLTWVAAKDADAYFFDLYGERRRRFRQLSFQLEAAYSLRDWLDDRAHLLVQWGAHQQRSNIDLFSNRGQNVAVGVRWRW